LQSGLCNCQPKFNQNLAFQGTRGPGASKVQPTMGLIGHRTNGCPLNPPLSVVFAMSICLGSIAPPIAFLISSASIQFQEKPFLRWWWQKYWGNGKILRFSTNITVCRCFSL